jgi:Zn-dependent protease with chaperone function
VWEHERIATWAVSHVPVSQERKLGEAVFAQTKAKLKLVDGPPAALVKELGARLTKGSAYTYEFYVADDSTVNAFAMPGGFVVMHTGLLALADSAEEVAGVLAHEIQHVEKRHSLKAIAKNAGLMVTISMVFGDLGGLPPVFIQVGEPEVLSDDARWLAQRLAMGHTGSVSRLVRAFGKDMANLEKLRELEKMLKYAPYPNLWSRNGGHAS